MNVYIYGGQSRYDATESIVKDNMQVEVGKNYSFDATKGILVIAYPNQDVDTDFEFKYWVAEFKELSWTDMLLEWNFESEDGDAVFLSFVIIAAVVLTIVFCLCFCICRRCCRKNTRVEIVDDDVQNHHLGTNSPRHGNDTSV